MSTLTRAFNMSPLASVCDISNLADTAPEKQQFFKITADALKLHYKTRLITAEAYILYLVSIHRTPGWKWSIDPKEFCTTWEIAKSSFYRAIARLKAKGLMNWDVQGKINLWYGTDVSVTNYPKRKTVSPKHETSSPIRETPVPSVRLKKLETPVQQSVQSPTDNSYLITNKIDNHISAALDNQEVACAQEKEEEQESASHKQVPVQVAHLNIKTLPEPELELELEPEHDEEVIEVVDHCARTRQFPGLRILNRCLKMACLRLHAIYLVRSHPEWSLIIEDGVVKQVPVQVAHLNHISAALDNHAQSFSTS